MAFGWAWLSSILSGSNGAILARTGDTSFDGLNSFNYDTSSDSLVLTGSFSINGQARVEPVTLVDEATIAVDCSLSNNFIVGLEGNRTLGNPTNLVGGSVYNFTFKQDGTGSRTLAYASKYKFSGGTAPTLTTTVNGVDFMSCVYDSGDDILLCNLVGDFQ